MVEFGNRNVTVINGDVYVLAEPPRRRPNLSTRIAVAVSQGWWSVIALAAVLAGAGLRVLGLALFALARAAWRGGRWLQRERPGVFGLLAVLVPGAVVGAVLALTT